MKPTPLLKDLLWHLKCRHYAADDLARARRLIQQGGSGWFARRCWRSAETFKRMAASELAHWQARITARATA